MEVNLEDLSSFNETLAEKLYKQPTEHLPVFEEAAKEVADELTAPRPEGEENVEDIQIMLSSDANASNLRELKVIMLQLYQRSKNSIYGFLFLVRCCVSFG